MEKNNKQPRDYRGTRGLSLAIVIGVALGTVIGKLMDNMNIGLMLGLVLGVCGWTLLFNRRKPGGQEQETEEQKEASEDSEPRS